MGRAYSELQGSKLKRKERLCLTLADRIDPSHGMPKEIAMKLLSMLAVGLMLAEPVSAQDLNKGRRHIIKRS